MLLLEKLKKIDATIGIVGLGYVGLPLANASAKAGYRVIGFDVDAGKIDKLYSGHSYIEAVSDADIEATADLSDWTVD
ncbi:UDP-N-acetyl-D-glucosamine dehydrogenase, partial [Sulfitobacter sp. S66]